MKRKIKLSTLMFIGAQRTTRTERTLYEEPDMDAPDLLKGIASVVLPAKTCAWGSAAWTYRTKIQDMRPSASDIDPWRQSLSKVKINRNHIPICALKVLADPCGLGAHHLFDIVYRLNDKVEWPRAKIAGWVDSLIEEYGYNLYVEIPEDAEVPDVELPEGFNTVYDREQTGGEQLSFHPTGDSLPEQPEQVAVESHKEPEEVHA